MVKVRMNLYKKKGPKPLFFIIQSRVYNTTSCFVADNPFGPLTVMI